MCNNINNIIVHIYSLIAPVSMLLLQCKHGRYASSVLQVTRFLLSKFLSGTEIHRRHLTQYGDGVLPRRCGHEWMFKNVWRSMSHGEGAGCSLSSTADEKIQEAGEMIMANRWVIIEENFVVWKYTSTYSRPDRRKHYPIGFWGSGTPCLHSRSRVFGLSSRWLTQRCVT